MQNSLQFITAYGITYSYLTYSSQMDGRSCFYRLGSESSGAWEPYFGFQDANNVQLKNLEPCCLVLPRATNSYVPCPQKTVSFSMSLEMQGSNSLMPDLRLEATQNGIAMPIRAALLSTNVQPTLLEPQEFDISTEFSFSPLTKSGAIDPRLLRFEFQLDLSRASPGLLVFNLWSSTDKPLIPMLLASGSALLLPKGLEQVSKELNHAAYACGENLLADLADILAVNALIAKSSRISLPNKVLLHKSQLLVAAKDIVEWSREAGLHHLERLASDQVDSMELPEQMPIPLSAWWSGWWTVHGIIFSAGWNLFRGIKGLFIMVCM